MKRNEVDLKEAMQAFVAKIEVPEQRLEELYLDQEIEKKSPVIINIFLFVLGIWLLMYGVIRTYEFASQEDPHSEVQKRMYQNKMVR